MKVLILLAGLLFPGLATAQGNEIHLSADTAGLPMVIDAYRVATLGQADGDATVGPRFRITRGPGGVYYFGHSYDPAWIKVFDSDGTMLQRFGGPGEGPGEFDFVRILLSSDSALYVFDSGNGRLSVIGIPDHRLTETRWYSGDPMSAALLTDGSLVYNASVATRHKAGLALHLLEAPALNESLSFGDDGSGYRADMPERLWRALAPSASGDIWSASVAQYRISKWDRLGRRLATYVRESEWFLPHSSLSAVSPEHAPQPFLYDIWEDDNGLVWVLVLVADEEWSEGLARNAEGIPGHPQYEVRDYGKVFDSIVEVFDPESGQLLGSRTFDACFESFAGEGEIASYRITREGYPVIDVWRLGLLQRNGG